jgi:GNAT superfamily N-acetyltransferase
MIEVVKTDSSNANFQYLVALLDADLAIRDGEDHAFYAQFNKTDKIKYVILVYLNKSAIACGAIREWGSGVMEIKRMFVLPEFRRQGFAQMVVSELEKWAGELGSEKCILETGKNQPEAIRLYQKIGFQITPNYGQYVNVENSVCMQKLITPLSI